jgi:hypothetical protein
MVYDLKISQYVLLIMMQIITITAYSAVAVLAVAVLAVAIAVAVLRHCRHRHRHRHRLLIYDYCCCRLYLRPSSSYFSILSSVSSFPLSLSSLSRLSRCYGFCVSVFCCVICHKCFIVSRVEQVEFLLMVTKVG